MARLQVALADIGKWFLVRGKKKLVLCDDSIQPVTPYFSRYHPALNPAPITNVELINAAGDFPNAVPAGKYWLLVSAMCMNDTRACILAMQLAGGRNFHITGPTTGAGVYRAVDLLRTRVDYGEIVTVVDLAFVALDVVAKILNYEEYDLPDIADI